MNHIFKFRSIIHFFHCNIAKIFFSSASKSYLKFNFSYHKDFFVKMTVKPRENSWKYLKFDWSLCRDKGDKIYRKEIFWKERIKCSWRDVARKPLVSRVWLQILISMELPSQRYIMWPVLQVKNLTHTNSWFINHVS